MTADTLQPPIPVFCQGVFVGSITVPVRADAQDLSLIARPPIRPSVDPGRITYQPLPIASLRRSVFLDTSRQMRIEGFEASREDLGILLQAGDTFIPSPRLQSLIEDYGATELGHYQAWRQRRA